MQHIFYKRYFAVIKQSFEFRSYWINLNKIRVSRQRSAWWTRWNRKVRWRWIVGRQRSKQTQSPPNPAAPRPQSLSWRYQGPRPVTPPWPTPAARQRGWGYRACQCRPRSSSTTPKRGCSASPCHLLPVCGGLSVKSHRQKGRQGLKTIVSQPFKLRQCREPAVNHCKNCQYVIPVLSPHQMTVIKL